MTAPATFEIVQDIRIPGPSLTKERLSIPHAAIDFAPIVGADTDPNLPHSSRSIANSKRSQ